MDCAKSVSRVAAHLCVALALIGLLVLAGCGDSDNGRFHASGNVTWGGEPIPIGAILFIPDTSQGNSGPAVTVRIKDSRYDTRSMNKEGHVGGPHVIEISGRDGVAKKYMRAGSPLFRNYKTTVNLSKEDAEDLDFEVPGDWK